MFSPLRVQALGPEVNRTKNLKRHQQTAKMLTDNWNNWTAFVLQMQLQVLNIQAFNLKISTFKFQTSQNLMQSTANCKAEYHVFQLKGVSLSEAVSCSSTNFCVQFFFKFFSFKKIAIFMIELQLSGGFSFRAIDSIESAFGIVRRQTISVGRRLLGGSSNKLRMHSKFRKFFNKKRFAIQEAWWSFR